MSHPLARRIAIIGAGSSGLAQLKQLLDAFSRPGVESRLEVVVFESRSEIGGVWLSQAEPKAYRQAVAGSSKGDQLYIYPPGGDDPTPMYDGLRTNLPSDIMAYRDLPFPPGTPVFPDQRLSFSSLPLDFPAEPRAETVLEYLQSYSTTFNLLPHIRFNTRVDRLYHTASPGRRWTIESSTSSSPTSEEFDYVCVANGHYSDVWLPSVPGLRSFPGEVMHSRFYRRPEDYAGQTVLVVGSFASGTDLSRQLASLNLHKYDPSGRPFTPDGDDLGFGFTKVYVSSSGEPNITSSSGPWDRYTTHVPLIHHVEGPTIFLEDHPPLEGVDVMIFATGYNFSLPFCKRTDAPWCEKAVLDVEIEAGERGGGEERDVGGIKGLAMRELDGLMLFLEGDRSIAFPVLQYGIVPFPFAETQARLTSLLWADLLPLFPPHPTLPPNPSNPYSAPLPTPPPAPSGTPPKPLRKSMIMRQQLVFGSPYHYNYEEVLMDLCLEADERAGVETAQHWRAVEGWKRERRADLGLRVRTLGY